MGTVYAVVRSVMKHKPLFERVVTVTGKSLKNRVTTFAASEPDLTTDRGRRGLPEDTGKVIGGGPMMGKALTNTSIPVRKARVASY